MMEDETDKWCAVLVFFFRSFLSGRGRLLDHGDALISPGLRGRRHPYYPRKRGKRLPMGVQLYKNYNPGYEHDWDAYFPVHMPCLEVLCGYLTPEMPSPYLNLRLDEDALYLAFFSLMEGSKNSLMIGYGAAEDGQEQCWMSRAGQEHVVAHPRINLGQRAVVSLLKRTISRAMPREFLTADLGQKVWYDPFRSVPYDILFKLSNLLDDASLFSLCSASWPAHCYLRGNQEFWRHRMTRISMPWFEEILPLLRNEDLMRGKDWKSVMVELNALILGKEGTSGVLMGIKNRKRIWGQCRVIGREYWMMVEETGRRGSREVLCDLTEA